MDAASIEELNKIRKSMGMKPLPVPGGAADTAPKASTSAHDHDDEDAPSTLETREAKGYDNFRKLQEDKQAKKQREQRAADIKKARDRAQRDAVIQGKGLVEQADADLGADTKSWLKNQKKRQSKIEKGRKEDEAKEAAAAARQAAKEHSAANVRVGHDVSSFLDGSDQILTLKDTGVLDEDEDDELEALALREEEKLEERMKLKKKKPLYDPTDETQHSILGQYDEEIDGKKTKSFSLNALGDSNDLEDILASAPVQKRKRLAMDIDEMDDAPAPSSDYVDIPIKKSKKKKAKATRKRGADDDDGLLPTEAVEDITNQDMDIDDAPVFKKRKKVVDEDYVDDDDLQATLNLQRRSALKKRKPEDIVKEAAELAKADEEETQQGGLVIDEITGFVDQLREPEHDTQAKKPKAESHPTTTKMEEESSDDDEDEEMHDAVSETKDHQHPTDAQPDEDLAAIGVDEEHKVSQGMGATLELLRKRKLIADKDAGELNDKFRRQQFFLAELKRQMALFDEEAKRQREQDRASGRLERMSAREKENWQRQQNTARDQHQARILQRLYSEGYQPNVELKYVDEHGRRLDQKEAWRHLSHAFHGKGSGKGKTDKKLKKIEAEKRREAESILDVSQNVGMSSAASHQIKKRREAGVRLA